MKLKRFLTQEEFLEFCKLSQKKELISKEAYTGVKKNKDTEYITKVLKDLIEGFSEFSAFSNKKTLRVQYNYNYNSEGYFVGVGYITIKELKEGFKNEYITK